MCTDSLLILVNHLIKEVRVKYSTKLNKQCIREKTMWVLKIKRELQTNVRNRKNKAKETEY